jgi:diguanylate cyclase (GGDEF)-like protein
MPAMRDGLRTIRVVTTDESLIASTRAAVIKLEGWEVESVESVDELLEAPPTMGDVILLDAWQRGANVYESCRRLTGKSRCRAFVVLGHDNQNGESIARFCGASGVLHRPLVPSKLAAALEQGGHRPQVPEQRRNDRRAPSFPEDLLTDISGRPDASLVGALTDPETSLFNYAFLNYKLDEEFKRAVRFDHPLSCVMLGFEGEVAADVLGALAGIFLQASRDTDILGRFDKSSFLFLLPNTGPDGAGVMAERVRTAADEMGLADLVGDALVLSIGISTCPHPEVGRREDLYARAREAFFAARREGGGVVTVS